MVLRAIAPLALTCTGGLVDQIWRTVGREPGHHHRIKVSAATISHCVARAGLITPAGQAPQILLPTL